MKRQLAIVAALAVLALPALAGAEEEKGIPGERGWVDAAALTNLLEEKGLITPQEQEKLTHPMEAPSVDDQTMQEIFRTAPYRDQ
ncbi:MAG: hypothetical protein AUH29_00275 [Candidatus Rokubacteria bacterium 13_1_40CM_69_27]|nr:MAG: hypothetical protein AUH29_00275 [Candidatus Rokubacteria bacterium 13_1_40CM_69_27]OLC31063.1 MAG: hypothetical protein AUH81_18700 [Candidatus Rokubacteria bacterium 13_1_40CM_4_69_5]